jgi:hypothetical protein
MRELRNNRNPQLRSQLLQDRLGATDPASESAAIGLKYSNFLRYGKQKLKGLDDYTNAL